MLHENNDATKLIEGIEISSQDDRLYRNLVLENELQVLLISDSETDKSAVAMDVRVGHLNDPDGILGLAHFLEHMLFLGTEKYPDENSYSCFLSTHGGSSNAFTSMSHTNFYFDINPPFLQEGIDRFAQFFINPLFTESATYREMKAVDSEHVKNLQNDFWRISQLDKGSSSRLHPFHRFGSGNLETLDSLPKEAGIEIRDQLLEFHQKYYSANLMKLVVYGSEDLSTLETWVRECFHAVKNTNCPIPSFPGTPYGEEQVRREFHIVPVKDMRVIKLNWPLPGVQHLFLKKPCHYLTHLLGHEGKGSLISLLKKKGWVNELSSYLFHNESDWSTFSVYMESTEEGLKHYNEVVQVVFQYIAMLKKEKPQRWVFEETQKIENINFKFKNKENPMNYVSDLAGRMHYLPFQYIVSGSTLLYEFDPHEISTILDHLCPSNLRLMVAGRSFEGTTDQIEKWYGTSYRCSPLKDELIQQWEKVPLDPKLHLPLQNELISVDFEMVKPPLFPKTATKKLPYIIFDNEQFRIWYKYDHVFNKPKIQVMMQILTPYAYDSPDSVVLTDIYIRCIKDDLSEYSYQAHLAGLRYFLTNTKKGIELYVTGYSHKLPLLVERIVSKMRNLVVSAKTFERLKDTAKRDFINFRHEQPYQHALYDCACVVQSKKWHNDDKLQVIDSLQLEDMNLFVNRLFRQVYIEALVHGNISHESASGIIDLVWKELRPRILLPSQRPQLRLLDLAFRTDYIYQTKEPNPENNNSAIHVLFQVGPEIVSQPSLDYLDHITSEPCFNQLRTKEQLGYIVYSGPYRTEGVEGLQIIVQSDQKGPQYLDERIEAFLEDFRGQIVEMSEETFKRNVDTVVAKKLEKPKSPMEECMRYYWNEILENKYVFDRLEQEAKMVSQLTKAKVIDFFDTYFTKTAKKRSKLSNHVFGSNHLHEMDNIETYADGRAVDAPASIAEVQRDGRTIIKIRDIYGFKRGMPLYPSKTKYSISPAKL